MTATERYMETSELDAADAVLMDRDVAAAEVAVIAAALEDFWTSRTTPRALRTTMMTVLHYVLP